MTRPSTAEVRECGELLAVRTYRRLSRAEWRRMLKLRARVERWQGEMVARAAKG